MRRKYYHISAQGKVLGRLATQSAKILSGRNKVEFTPNVDGGDFVIVTDSDGVIVTGNKRKGKKYQSYSGYPGGIKEISFEDQMKKDSTRVVYSAVRGMLPKNKLRSKMLKRLIIFKNSNHNYKIDQEI
ncbi:MAG: 50S ribosomal protein L13 [Candidatus Moranbacteria bacterium]|jgi:large subunit ribosomal protein L13|nr:50S ribosomal protein L13 [Candidatus Moranbacteria bacterium]MDD5651819.1 50S ribosomal protein L13 [Candidatus Moranbacteria bacterium]MDX9855488.1 50S ribosomal protein L13 [Candidatus Moranbacteria bacterium]